MLCDCMMKSLEEKGTRKKITNLSLDYVDFKIPFAFALRE